MERPLIIIINADMAFLDMMREFLRDEGYEAITVQEKAEVFQIILNRKPQLVIIELLIHDPEAGLMVLNKMRLHPQTARIPVIIASTATQLIRDNEEHLRAKGCDILRKPFELEELLTMVERMIAPPADLLGP